MAMKFSRRVRLLREALGLSQEALARRIGVSHRTVWRWEQGTNLPASEAIIRRIEALEREARRKR